MLIHVSNHIVLAFCFKSGVNMVLFSSMAPKHMNYKALTPLDTHKNLKAKGNQRLKKPTGPTRETFN